MLQQNILPIEVGEISPVLADYDGKGDMEMSGENVSISSSLIIDLNNKKRVYNGNFDSGKNDHSLLKGGS